MSPAQPDFFTGLIRSGILNKLYCCSESLRCAFAASIHRGRKVTNSTNLLEHANRVHFIGIGGCSMSGLARILQEKGYIVTGSDMKPSNFTALLEREGIPVTIGHDQQNVEGADAVIYSAAIKPYNPEYAYAAAHDIPMLERSKLLGLLSREYNKVACVAGCHGKTTITSMLALITERTNADCTVHVGGMVDFLEGGVRIGQSDVFITEACEYVRSFLTLHPTDILVNNIDDDHLDCYRDIDDIVDTFVEFIEKQPPDGVLLLDTSDELAARLAPHAKCRVVSINNPPVSDWYLADARYDEHGFGSADIVRHGEKAAHLQLHVPGAHNLRNALAAVAFAAEAFGTDPQTACDALTGYRLAGRRFELIGEKDGVRIFHDYAHHPNEIKACLDAARLVPHEKMWVVFQCNSFTRARTLKDKYASSFSNASDVIVPDIYPGRDTDTQGIHATDLVAAINKVSGNCMYIPTFPEIAQYLRKNWKPGDIVITLGSGDVNRQQLVFLEDSPGRS